MAPLEEEVQLLKARVVPLEEEVRLLKGNLQAVAGERDKSRRQIIEASLHVDSLTRDLEVERSKGQALRARMGGKRCYLVSSSFRSVWPCLTSFYSQSSRRIWMPLPRPLRRYPRSWTRGPPS